MDHTFTIALPPDLAQRDRCRRAFQRLARIHHDALAPISEVSIVPEGVCHTTHVPDDALPLADPSPQFTVTDALTLLTPVAAALALVHDSGLVCGPVSATAVWRCSDGRGLLVPAAARTQVLSTDSSEDVADFVALLAQLLPENSVGADVVGILIAGADPDPLLRPSMARVSAVLDLALRSLPEGQYMPAPVSPQAHRRARPLQVTHEEAPSPGPVPPASESREGRSRGRHAASARTVSDRLPVRLSWRWGVVLVGVITASLIGLSAVGADEPAVGVCAVVPQAEAAPAAPVTSDPERPGQSTKQSSGRSR